MRVSDAARWRERFETFCSQKTAGAVAAVLPPYVTDYCCPSSEMAEIGNAWSAAAFDGAFYESRPKTSSRPACSLVFVQSADGNTGADDPSSLGGGDTDKHLIYEGLSRVACDAVLAGARTVRGSGIVFSVWHPEMVRLRAALGLPRHPVQIVASGGGIDPDECLLLNVPEIPAVLITLDEVADRMEHALRARPWVSVIRLQAKANLPAAFARLRAMGLRRVSSVGGRTLARELLDAGLVDDVYLTTAAREGGEPGTPLHVRPWRGPVILRKHGTGVEAGVVFEHILPAR